MKLPQRLFLLVAIHPQVEGELSTRILPQEIKAIFRVPWGHHRHHKLILDKVKGNDWRHLIRDYVRQVTERPELQETEVFRYVMAG